VNEHRNSDAYAATHVSALPLDTKLHEFRIETVLGHGGFGITYRAIDTLLEEKVALKEYFPNSLAVRASDATVRPKSSGDIGDFETGLKAFLHEARVMARFRHPNIVQVRRFFEFHGTGYIVQDFEDGQTLSRMLEAGPIDEATLRRILLGVLDGLESVHNQAVLHRDLKPDNIIIRRDGSPILIDFGAARDYLGRHTRSITVIGAGGYTPPEQWGIDGQQGPWTDFYALGAIAYRCVTGTAPPMSLQRLRSDTLTPAGDAAKGKYDPSLLQLVDWMLEVDERDRPESVSVLRDALTDGSSDLLAGVRSSKLTFRLAEVGPDSGTIEFDQTIAADELELAFEARPPGKFIGFSKDGLPAWQDSPYYFSLTRLDNADSPVFLLPPGICNAIAPGAKVTVTSSDGFIRCSGTWIGFRKAGVWSKNQLSLAALVLAVLLLAGFGSYELRQRVATANFQEISGELNSAGYNEAAVRNLLSSCKTKSCPTNLRVAAEHRLEVIGNERTARYEAQDDLKLLQTYIQDCQACEFLDDAKTRVGQLKTLELSHELDAAGTNSSALASFLGHCGENCPDAFRSLAKSKLDAAKRADLARSEETAYRAARGDIDKLQAYLSCVICAYRDAAQREIMDLRRQRIAEQESMMFQNAHGEEYALQRYIDSCSICTYRAAAESERDRIQHDAKMFTFHVCNNSNLKAYVAVSGRKDPDGTAWTIAGYWNILPGNCTDIGPWSRGQFYYMADGEGGHRGWYGSFPLCVPNVRFEKINYGGNCTAGEKVKKFYNVLVSGSQYNWNLGN
jgi:serine/threonine protein kinase/uncharacterized membrane protein